MKQSIIKQAATGFIFSLLGLSVQAADIVNDKSIGMEMARDIGQSAGLQFVYTGNVPGDAGENTFCPGCGEVVMERWGFRLGSVRVKNGACSLCGQSIAGVWE